VLARLIASDCTLIPHRLLISGDLSSIQNSIMLGEYARANVTYVGYVGHLATRLRLAQLPEAALAERKFAQNLSEVPYIPALKREVLRQHG